MGCKKNGYLTRERYNDHVLIGEKGKKGQIRGKHKDSEFLDTVGGKDKLHSRKEIDPPGGIYDNKYYRDNNSTTSKHTFDTTIYSEDDMFKSMNDSLSNAQITDIKTFKFRSTGTINGKTVTFEGHYFEEGSKVSTMYPVGS